MPDVGSYDIGNVVIFADTASMIKEAEHEIVNVNKSIVASLETIILELNDLQLSWVGGSAALAQDLAIRWQRCVDQMYGTRNNPGQGVLNQLANAVYSAAGNYARTDHQVTEYFAKALNALWTPAVGGGGQDPNLPIIQIG